jgi:hypothetical protein
MKQDVRRGFLLRSILMLIALISVPLSVTASDKEIKIALTSDAVHVDPQQGDELTSNIMYSQYYDPLVRRPEKLSTANVSTCLTKIRPGYTYLIMKRLPACRRSWETGVYRSMA